MKIINVVSGKGGTGKTLVVAVLAELLSRRGTAKVLVVDLDIFVRGLTTLLYFQSDRRTKLIPQGRASVSDMMVSSSLQGPGIVRYHSFDVWPSVSRIDLKLLARELVNTNQFETKQIVAQILATIPKDYDIVLLDSRAGFDELVAATYANSDFTINIEEDDLVSIITSENLVGELKEVDSKPIYRVINKSHGRYREQVGDLGQIPFDADIMRSYGEDEFWPRITRSLIEPSLVKIWNNLCKNENMSFNLTSFYHGPFAVEATNWWLGQLTSFQRVLGVYGFVLTLGGFFVAIEGRGFFYDLARDPVALGGFIATCFGALMLIGTFAVFTRTRR